MTTRVRLFGTGVAVDRDGTEVIVRNQPGLLLRLLLIWKDRHESVSTDMACAVLSIQGSVANYVLNLRKEIRDIRGPGGNYKIVTQANAKISLKLDVDSADYVEFRHAAQEALELGEAAGEELSPEVASKIIEIADRVLPLWEHSPAEGLAAWRDADEHPSAAVGLDPNRRQALERDLSELLDICDGWTELWRELRILRARCAVLQGSRRLIREAVGDLLAMLRETPWPPEAIWDPLLRGCISTRDPRRNQAAEQCRQFYREEDEPVPDGLAELLAEIGPSDAVESARPRDPGDSQPRGSDPRLRLMDDLGLVMGGDMRTARMEPMDCLTQVESRLYFSGVLASKWVEGHVRWKLDEVLTRLDEMGPRGTVRFLTINPFGSAYDRLEQLRGGRLSRTSVEPLLQMIERHPSFEVRVTEQLPAFRIIVIDDALVTFSPYKLEWEAYKASQGGYGAPHVPLNPQAPWSLAAAFRLLFEEAWRHAPSLKEVVP